MKNSEDPQLDANDSIDVEPLLSEIGVEVGSDPVRDRAAAKTFLKHLVADGNTDAFITKLFPNGIPKDDSFFERIHQIRDVIGIGEFARKAVAILWSHALTQLGREDQKQLLMAFTCKGSFGFFEDVESLPEVIENHVYEAVFMADWLEALLAVVENDMAQNGVWNTIEAFCKHHSAIAIEVAWLLPSPPKSLRTNIASYMLGVLRTLDLSTTDGAEFSKLDSFFNNHDEHVLRRIHNWSWFTTAKKRGITKTEFEALVSRIEFSDEDHDNIFCVATQVLNRCDLSADQTEVFVAWVDANLTEQRSRDAKFFIARSAEKFIEENDGRIELAISWLLKIQPIPVEDSGTWRAISDAFVDLLKADAGKFDIAFTGVCKTSANQILHLMADTRQFENLKSKLKEAGEQTSKLVGPMLVSLNTGVRRLGLYLFDELDQKTIPIETFKEKQRWAKLLILCETQRTILNPSSTARLLCAIAPTDDESENEFRDEWLDELKLQCRNFSGGFRKEINEIAADNDLVKSALEEVDGYFDDLNKARKAGINAMQVPGFGRAAYESRKRFSRQARKSAEEHSVFMQMCKNVTQLYGNMHSQFINGELQNAMPFSTHESSIEIPIVDFCDPEEMAYRRLVAASKIRDIENEFGDRQEENDEQ